PIAGRRSPRPEGGGLPASPAARGAPRTPGGGVPADLALPSPGGGRRLRPRRDATPGTPAPAARRRAARSPRPRAPAGAGGVGSRRRLRRPAPCTAPTRVRNIAPPARRPRPALPAP